MVWHGDQYRLVSPWDHDFASMMYVNDHKDRAIIFNYQVNNRYATGSLSPVVLKGLDPQKKYSVTEINLFPDTKSSLPEKAVYSGNYLMSVGINPDVNTNRTSVILELSEVK